MSRTGAAVPLCAIPFLIILTSGCGGPADSPPLLVQAAAATDGVRWLELPGRLVDPDPEPVLTPVPWLVLDDAAWPGQRVEPGDALLRLSVDALGLALVWREAELAVAEAQHRRQALASAAEVEVLDEQRRGLEAEIAVRDARIATSRVRDAQALAIAGLELSAARAVVARRRQELADAQQRRELGLASAQELAEAVDSLARSLASEEVAVVAEEVTTATTGATTRYREQAAQLRLQAELGEAGLSGGVRRRLETVQELLAARSTRAQADRARPLRELLRDRALIKNPVVTSLQPGVVLPTRGTLGPGAKPGPGPVIHLAGRTLTCRVAVPEAWRTAVLALGLDAGGPAPELVLPSGTRCTGRVLGSRSVGSGGGGRRLELDIVLDEQPSGSAVGMLVQVRLPLVVGSAPVLPGWLLHAPEPPTVQLADGALRPLTGIRLADALLATDGVDVGTALRVPTGETAVVAQRCVGQVEAVERILLEARPWRSLLIEELADGVAVDAGQVVARFASTRGQGGVELEDEIRAGEAEIAERLVAMRIAAETRVDSAAVAWRKAQAEHLLASFEHLVQHEGMDDVGLARAIAAARGAELDLAADERRLHLLSAGRPDLSEADQDRARRTRDRAALRMRRAQLDAAAAGRFRSWIELQRAAAAEARAEDAVTAARRNLGLERIAARSEQAKERRAIERLRSRLADRHRDQAQLTLRAPAAGVLVHLGEPRQPGDWLRLRNPSLIAVGPRREMHLDLPARTWGRWREGDLLTVHLPACGPAPLSGRVRAVAQALRIPTAVLVELGSRGSAGVPERVYRVVLELELPAGTPPPPPGSEGWVEL